MLTAVAPAKLNLTLHVTGQRADGYHLLDSLVVFAGVYDRLTFRPAPDLRLSVTGPFSDGVPSDDSNLILRAAALLRRMRNVTAGAEITLDKQLPHAAGIGSGSSDAAATLKALAGMWDVAPLPHTAPELARLGADVPVCTAGPAPQRMQGIGDDLSAMPALPPCAAVLVNPRVAVPTKAVFDRLESKTNTGMDAMPAGLDFAGLTAWLAAQRNDLQGPALDIAPDVARALRRLNNIQAVAWAGMSGSGATCVALVADMAAARHVARVVQVAEMGWWVTPAEIL